MTASLKLIVLIAVVWLKIIWLTHLEKWKLNCAWYLWLRFAYTCYVREVVTIDCEIHFLVYLIKWVYSSCLLFDLLKLLYWSQLILELIIKIEFIFQSSSIYLSNSKAACIYMHFYFYFNSKLLFLGLILHNCLAIVNDAKILLFIFTIWKSYELSII